MQSDFSRSLSLLRQERGLSQRIAAKDLGISQALLSHYENGAREPGLAFVIRACDYYDVSADFLLGRTLSRDGTTIHSPDAYEHGEEKFLHGDALIKINKSLLSNSLTLLFDLLWQVGRRDAIQAASNYLGTSIYKLFRHLYRADTSQNEDFFSIPPHQFMTGIANTDLIYAECEYVDALSQHAKERGLFPPMNNAAMSQHYPGLYQSLLQIIYGTGERISRRSDTSRKADDSTVNRPHDL
ncbi:MAG: helix-turn-helix domain-containing protein [Oscillospiraceae bacterium]|nr:helix-turn-helix domain-containing protein [Oscillospiraceae bacterium]